MLVPSFSLMIFLFQVNPEVHTIPPWSDMPGGIVNWALATLIAGMVWLVKKLVDNNQDILKALKEESKTNREENEKDRDQYRKDVAVVMQDNKDNRLTFTTGFDKLSTAMADNTRSLTMLTELVRSKHE